MRFPDKPTDPMRSWRDRVASARACAHLAQECARAPKLDELPQDALREIFGHLKVPLAFKLTCRAVRAAAPKRTLCSSSHALHPIRFFKWAYATGLKITHSVVAAVARQGDLEALLLVQARRHAAALGLRLLDQSFGLGQDARAEGLGESHVSFRQRRVQEP